MFDMLIVLSICGLAKNVEWYVWIFIFVLDCWYIGYNRSLTREMVQSELRKI